MATFKKPLEGIKVLDFTQALAGVFCAYQMGDLGATVYKVERYSYGDQSRVWPPFINGISLGYASFNRNKKSLSIDLRKPEAKSIILKLVKECDVVLENFKVGTLEKMGLGYDELSKINPQIIYGSVSGYGVGGKLSLQPCYDNIAAARGGITMRSGRPDGPPIKPGYSICDNWSGLNLFNAICMALVYRQRTGKGTRVELSMADCAFFLNDWPVLEISALGTEPARRGNQDASIAPYGEFAASDGYIVLGVVNEKQWGKLCDALELDSQDPRFCNNTVRMQNLPQLVEYIESKTKTYSKFDLEAMLEPLGVSCGAVLSIPEVMKTQHPYDEEMIVYVDQENVGKMPTVGIPMKFSKTPGDVNSSAPMLGANSREILEEIGYTTEQIDALINNSVVEEYKQLVNV